MCKRLITTHLAIFFTFCLVIVLQNVVFAAQSEQAEGKYTLNDVRTEGSADSFSITLSGSAPPAFTSRELYDPYRLIIDIAEVSFAKNLNVESLLAENKFTSLQTTIVRGLKPEITRFIFTISDGYRQKIDRKGNDLIIDILPLAAKAESPVKKALAAKEEKTDVSEKVSEKSISDANNTIIDDLIASSVMGGGGAAADAESSASNDLAQNFDFSGYKRERISVDFYKIDLHNVFRLFRQVSGLNLIVDESVSGSLTVALNDVPWDFALDIILNLSDLAKEERFNTVIIYPKSKEFTWPERATDNISFEADLEIAEQEALIIQQSANQPKEIMQAKEWMRKARIEEKANDYEDAADFYVKAIELWPANSKLIERLSALYLVRLGMNAKAAFYAKKSLELKADNYKAALYAAIAMANMNRVPEAVEYFSQSISGSPPMKEALASFAAFSESNGRPEAALKLYDKYNTIYGESVNTMVAKARIYDVLEMKDKALVQYETILSSGYQLSTDLKRYVESRVAEGK